MTVASAFYLAFHAPLRVGGGARDAADAARDFPSDTLSAALVVAAADLHGDTVDGRSLADLARDPPWVVSSLLPWATLGGARVRFFPRPAEYRFSGDADPKIYRRVLYLSEDLLSTPPSRSPHLSTCRTLAASSAHVRALTWQRRAARPSITLDRVTSASHLFHLEELAVATFPPGENATAGAWFAACAKDDAGMNLVRALFRHLADSGIGADRARGMGRFSLVGEEPLTLDATAQRRLLLGYASPDEALAKALHHAGARYGIVRRGGRAHGAQGGLGLPRKSLRLVTPGAVIPDAGPVVGRTRDVTPPGFADHPIYRDGRTLAWPLGEGA